MIAVDVVLRPSEEVNLMCKEKNKELTNRSISFDESIPHISLAMGVIKLDEIEGVKKKLNEISMKYLPLNLKINKIYTKKVSNGESVSGFGIENFNELQSLHEEILNELKEYFSEEVENNMLVNPDEVKESTLGIIKNFYRDSGFKNFFPHITLGVGELKEEELDIEFGVSKLSLFQLGNYCTCRKFLF